MATSKVKYIGELRTESEHLASGNQLISDAPIDNMGKGETFSPTDYCATSLAQCMLTIAGIYAQNQNYNIDGSHATVQKIMGSNPRRISQIDVNITFICSRKLNENEIRALENAAKSCPVAKSLHPDIVQNCSFVYL